ncbi:hypothetical protein A4X09_0g4495 [Tilletia walkeri]|uniref:Protein kinase domain-containing protein n=1 Tax=Tilletia walkeri TaxID=117179 RepID=A0A8X7N7P5_9BASI|nr:hypothetical protein A4X09_0g4495 [Tilletia walkeri]
MTDPNAYTLSASPDEAASSPIAIESAQSTDNNNFILSTSPDDDAQDNQQESLFANAPDTPLGRSKPLPIRRGPNAPPRTPHQPQRVDTYSTFASSPRSSRQASLDTSADSPGTASSSSLSRTGTTSTNTVADPQKTATTTTMMMTPSPSHTASYPISQSSSQTSNLQASPSQQQPQSQRQHFRSASHSRTMSTSSIGSSLGVHSHVPSPAHDRKAHDAYARSQREAQHSRGLSTSSSSGAMAIPGSSSSNSGSGTGASTYTGAAGLSSSPSRASSTGSSFPFGYRETLNARTENLADGSRTINQYRMLEQIGRGAYGVVYWAELTNDPSTTFAIKEFGKTRLRKTYRAANMRKMARMRGRGRGGGSMSAEVGRAESALAALAKRDAADVLGADTPPQPPTVVPAPAPATMPAPVPTHSSSPSTMENPPQLVTSPSTAELTMPILSSPISASPSGTETGTGKGQAVGIEALTRGIKALKMDPASSGAQRSPFTVDQQSAAELQQSHAQVAAGGPSPGSGSGPAAVPPVAAASAAPARVSTLETDPLFLIRHEIAILKKLNHPNVVKLYEVLDDPSQDSLYMVFESCQDGPIIEVHIHEQAEPLDEDAAREYFAQILLGIEYLHSNEIVHRDIKPDNILLTSDRQICKIVDFGVSEIFLKPNEEKLAKSAGTPAFMSPELCTAGMGDLHAMSDDIWALGVTLYCMVVGRLPFEKGQIYELFEAIKNDEPVYPSNLSPGLLDLLQGLLRKDHKMRYGIAEAREHPWVTMDGTYPLVSVEENLATVVHEITEEELERAICKITSVFTIARAVQKFKRAGSTGKSRTMSSGSASTSVVGSGSGSAGPTSAAGSRAGSKQGSMNVFTSSPAGGGEKGGGVGSSSTATIGPNVPSLATLVTRGLEALSVGASKVLAAPTVLSPTMETATEGEAEAGSYMDAASQK